MIERDVKSLLIENRGMVDQIDCLKKRIAELEAERDAYEAKSRPETSNQLQPFKGFQAEWDSVIPHDPRRASIYPDAEIREGIDSSNPEARP